MHPILDRLAKLSNTLDTRRRRRGRLVLNPPLSEAGVSTWERQHSISLPSEYRYFITTIGNGGYGPYGDFAPLDQWWSHLVGEPTPERLAAWPSAFFGYEPTVSATHGRLSEPPSTWEGALPPHAGTISVCDEGCGSLSLLVLTGPLRGRICGYDSMNTPYLYPQPDFVSWYEGWLDAETSGKVGLFLGAS